MRKVKLDCNIGCNSEDAYYTELEKIRRQSSTANNWLYTRSLKDFQMEAVVPEEKERFIERQSSQNLEIQTATGLKVVKSVYLSLECCIFAGLKI